ncbi:MAG: hypothetical protein J6D52_10975, partial [Clostridia bacterium]|nr:hypothetical protein [Clostridia bacterium]
MKESQKKDYEEILGLLKSQGGVYDLKLITKAYEFCLVHHAVQKRWTNEEYYINPFNVAKIIIGL